MRDLDLTTLRLFATVCETRNIARAAERENLAASAISKRLAHLEDQLGTPLLTRRRRGVQPTPAGETLLEHARAMLASAERIGRDMAAYAAGVRGQVRVLAAISAVAEFLSDDVAAFLQDPAHREIRVEIEEDVSTGVVRALREGSVSLGVCWDAADFEGLHTLPYRADHLAMVMHRGHPLARRKSVAFADTLEHEHVGLPAGSAVQLMLRRAAALARKPLRYRATVSTFDAALRVVRANLAISVVPREVAQPYAQAFGLAIVPLTDAWARRRFAICFRDEAALNPAARLLARFLAEAGARGARAVSPGARTKRTA